MSPARLLIDPPLPGPVNMARDEVLLQACTDPDGRPVVRFYAWSPPTVSLGYFQDHAEFQRLPPPAGGLPVVRRTTGGGAILHDVEITYSIVIPLTHPLVAGRPNHLYELAHQAIINAIGRGTRLLGCGTETCEGARQRGPFFCFARCHPLDVVVPDPNGIGGYSKIAGSAQRRSKTAILQHGSIILANRYPQQPCATWSQLAGRQVDMQTAIDPLLPQFAACLNTSLEPDKWRQPELEMLHALTNRHSAQNWLVHRRR